MNRTVYALSHTLENKVWIFLEPSLKVDSFSDFPLPRNIYFLLDTVDFCRDILDAARGCFEAEAADFGGLTLAVLTDFP